MHECPFIALFKSLEGYMSNNPIQKKIFILFPRHLLLVAYCKLFLEGSDVCWQTKHISAIWCMNGRLLSSATPSYFA